MHVQPLKVYIAAAEKALAQELADLLVSSGYGVRLFDHGYDLVALLDDWPDVFLIDIRLPDINGLEVCSWLKSHESSSHIPVILMSQDSYLKLLTPSSHADDFMDTRYAAAEVIDKINDCLSGIRADGRAF